MIGSHVGVSARLGQVICGGEGLATTKMDVFAVCPPMPVASRSGEECLLAAATAGKYASFPAQRGRDADQCQDIVAVPGGCYPC